MTEPSYKPVFSAPLYRGRVGRGWSRVIAPGQVKSLLRRHGFDWQPHAKLLVHYEGKMKVGKLLCWIGRNDPDFNNTNLYKLKG